MFPLLLLSLLLPPLHATVIHHLIPIKRLMMPHSRAIGDGLRQ
jgi:hypothetical protein